MPGGDDGAVGLDDQGIGGGIEVAQRGIDQSARAEGGIQATVGVIAGHHKIGGCERRTGLDRPRDDNRAIGRHGHRPGHGAGLERRHHRSAVAEGGIHAAVWAIASQGNGLAAGRPGIAGDDDLAVGLQMRPPRPRRRCRVRAPSTPRRPSQSPDRAARPCHSGRR
jgi:hypothetical protein